MIDKYTAQLDQDWASARDFITTTPQHIIFVLTAYLAADDPAQLIAWMKEDLRIADVVQRLALLALHQAAANHAQETK